ncbi:MAG TPA: alpha/beta fold hydrolase, partial [Planctomycetota bacterium]|nr:alpha/beta fold hydrolase [Planctomycetota bacterium]
MPIQPMGTTSFATGDPLVFQPFPLLRNAHLQTMLGHWLRVPARVPSRTEIVDLSDGDRLALEISEPIGDAAPARTVVLIHGLAGCHESAYLVRVAAKLVRRGMRAVRLNLRGCGSGAGLARGIFHSGQSDDLRQTIEALRARGQGSRVSVIGFSLGGNIALKLAGELGERGPELVDRVLAVCPPADLERCANLISR